MIRVLQFIVLFNFMDFFKVLRLKELVLHANLHEFSDHFYGEYFKCAYVHGCGDDGDVCNLQNANVSVHFCLSVNVCGCAHANHGDDAHGRGHVSANANANGDDDGGGGDHDHVNRDRGDDAHERVHFLVDSPLLFPN